MGKTTLLLFLLQSAFLVNAQKQETNRPCRSPTQTVCDPPNVSQKLSALPKIEDCTIDEKVQLDIEIHTDEYGEETSWILTSIEDGHEKFYGPEPGKNYSSNTLYVIQINVCLNHEYNFTLKDTAHDGICCSYGIGSCSLKTDNGYFPISGTRTQTASFPIDGAFNFSTFSTFSIRPFPSMSPPPLASTSIPNPSIIDEVDLVVAVVVSNMVLYLDLNDVPDKKSREFRVFIDLLETAITENTVGGTQAVVTKIGGVAVDESEKKLAEKSGVDVEFNLVKKIKCGADCGDVDPSEFMDNAVMSLMQSVASGNFTNTLNSLGSEKSITALATVTVDETSFTFAPPIVMTKAPSSSPNNMLSSSPSITTITDSSAPQVPTTNASLLTLFFQLLIDFLSALMALLMETD